MDKRIVIIGGGTGLSVLLSGLKLMTSDLHAVVNVADDGGSSGVLREDLGMLPPGDIRACILAMSNTPPLMEKLFGYRFDRGRFDGQSFGNLMIAALVEITGSIEKAIGEAGNIFNMTGKVYPVTDEHIELHGVLEDGTYIIGESKLPVISIERASPIKSVNIYPSRPKTSADVREVIETADIIVVGPGSHFTSILPALLVSGVKESILRSKGKCIYIANMMSQPGETDNFTLRDYITSIYDHLEDPIFDGLIMNEKTLEDHEIEAYRKQQATPLLMDIDDEIFLKDQGIVLKKGSYTNISHGYIRHNAKRVARDIVALEKELRLV